MAVKWVPFDGWTPGASAFGEGWKDVSDVVPAFDQWQPWHRFEAINTASAAFGPMVGSHTHLWPSGVGTTSYIPDAATLYTGSATRLFTLDPSSGVFTDVSRAANYGAGVGATPAGWRFASVGNDIWALNWFDVPQRRVANAGLFTNGVVSTFVPVPRHLATIREHLVVANLNQVGRFVDEIAWSDADDATNFDPPTGTSTSLASSKRLTSIPGQITALIGGQYGLAFKRRSIFLLEYTGTTQVLRPEVLSAHVGTAYASSIINTRYGRFFFGPDGFYRIVGLAEPEKVSPPGLDGTILKGLFSTQGAIAANYEDSQMVGFEVPGMPLIGWTYRSIWALGANTDAIFHNPVTGAWSTGTASAGLVGNLPVSAILSRPYGANVWDTTIGLTWDGSVSRVAPLSSTAVHNPELSLRYRPAAFEEAADKTSAQWRQSVIKGVLPVFSRTTADLQPTVQVQALLDPFGYPLSTPTFEARLFGERNTISGFYPFQVAGRLFRITLTFEPNDDFDHFLGLYIEQELLS